MSHVLYLNTLFGLAMLEEENGALTRVILLDGEAPEPEAIPCRRSAGPLLAEAEQQLNEYFAHLRTEFDLPLAPEGTAFQKKVWQAMNEIPYGQVCTYGQLAAAIGRPGAARAVGMACRSNPIWLIQPCHRVVGANGNLTGYAYGLPVKQALLEWEQE